MKKLLSIILFIVFVFLNVDAKSYPMKFIGIPMECKIDSFVTILERKGYIKCNEEPCYRGYKTVQFKGKFWKWNDCTINVRENKFLGIVTSVIVYTEKDINFKETIQSLDKKYGYHDTDSTEYVNSGFADYIWENSMGKIILSINEKEKFIGITYKDRLEVMQELFLEQRREEDEIDL